MCELFQAESVAPKPFTSGALLVSGRPACIVLCTLALLIPVDMGADEGAVASCVALVWFVVVPDDPQAVIVGTVRRRNRNSAECFIAAKIPDERTLRASRR